MSDNPKLVEDLTQAVMNGLQNPGYWLEFAILVVAGALAWFGARLVRRRMKASGPPEPGSIREVLGVLTDRLFTPTVFGVLTLMAAGVLQAFAAPFALVRSVAILALALAGVRLGIEVVKRVLRPGPLLMASEHVLSWSVWIVVALYLVGWIEPITAALDDIAIPIGKTRFSLLDAGRVLITLLVFLAIASYLGTLATRGIMASTQLSIGLRVGVAKFVRLFLLLIAALVALNAVGVDFAALTVFGGALGIGLGFGLQRIAANFVSGFILVGDRSIRQGDVITIGDRFGVVKELRARYIVVQDRDGVDTLIPNENVISSEVINWSYANRSIRLKLPVQISYDDEPREALKLLLEAASDHPRVQREPPPASRVMAFGDNGVELELRFWIMDPEDGINNVRSDLYLQIWDKFKAAGITIPYPQRDLHLRGKWPEKGETH